ncbi:electron transport complex subunit RsxC [Caproiciproducens sp. MSJ-32]|uniref:electron transport complex subunit RsxC n=1 Tax=Caproiciproducens sp. MSJ-32 TaxID=2841527 RepID=UPI001C10C415|nr:electron transport complex subunit RsxC [Caproiciproducens sp. MSJ-32]MBU5455437.1 electron transport complex subunit RsxC [Caproiciproducens sp. MSJ-32]
MKNLTFKGGVMVPGYKEFTREKPIERAIEPSVVAIPLHQHTGAPCEPIVKVGDSVKVGQKIGQSDAFVSAPVHSSISGIVKSITPMAIPTGLTVNCVVIESDGKNELHELVKPYKSLKELTSEEIINIIKEAGITGMGGAGFPTHVKLSPPPEKKIDTIIINGAECEPYITADHRNMVEEPEKIIFGLRAIMKAVVGVEKGIVAVEENKPDAIEALKNVCKDYESIKVVSLKAKYPQGDEKRLIDAILGRQVPSGGLPMDVGAVVCNVSTTKAVAEAISMGKPLYERVVTVTGRGIKEPKNLIVKIGTSFKDIIEQCGGFTENAPGKIIMGGPMMGISQFSINVPVIKGTGSILILTKEEAEPVQVSSCIKCGKCVEVCPVHLQPLYLSTYSLKEKFEKAEEFHALDCIECGACSYICPAKRPLVESIRIAKREIIAKRRGI